MPPSLQIKLLSLALVFWLSLASDRGGLVVVFSGRLLVLLVLTDVFLSAKKATAQEEGTQEAAMGKDWGKVGRWLWALTCPSVLSFTQRLTALAAFAFASAVLAEIFAIVPNGMSSAILLTRRPNKTFASPAALSLTTTCSPQTGKPRNDC